jgi:aminoglycoside phosphotransferase (APT) family kinase protein
VIGDIDIARVSSSWFSMVETLAKLHSYDPDAIGLGTYGKGNDFYLRHTNTFSRIEAQQAKVKDKDTGKELGRAHEKYDEMMSFVRKNVPGERKAIVHGDFKFDNMVSTMIYHWKRSTLGSRDGLVQEVHDLKPQD